LGDEFRITLSKQSARDLDRIFAHIAKKQSTNTAARVIDGILGAIDSLKTLPHRNVVVTQKPETTEPVRSLPVWPYMVYFRVHDGRRAVVVVRVRHGARQQLKRF
jgi:plasmid stabilization system protein ParE